MQHVKEAKDAFNAKVGKFRADVGAIKHPTPAAAEQAFQQAWLQFQRAYKYEYNASGEALATKVEWDFYHTEFDNFLASPLQYNVSDWEVTGEDAHQVLTVLERLVQRNPGGARQAIDVLEQFGLLSRLKESVSEGDRKILGEILAAVHKEESPSTVNS